MKGVMFVFFIFLVVGFVSADSVEESEVSVSIDGEAPAITILSPGEGTTYKNDTPLSVNYTIDEQSLDSVWYWLNDGVDDSSNNSLGSSLEGGFLLELPEGQYKLRIYANDSFSRVGFSDVNFEINNTEVLFCGDGTCSSSVGEDCNSCSTDCGSCPVDDGGGDDGGGGGGGDPSTTDPIVDPPVANGTPIGDPGIENLREIVLTDELQWIAVSDNEKIVFDIGTDVKYVVEFEIANEQMILKVLNGNYDIKKGEVLAVILGEKEVYIGGTEYYDRNGVITASLSREKVEDEVNTLFGEKERGLLGFIVIVGIFVVVGGALIFVVWYWKSMMDERNIDKLLDESNNKS